MKKVNKKQDIKTSIPEIGSFQKGKKSMTYQGVTYEINSGIISSPIIIKNFEQILDSVYEDENEFFELLVDGLNAAIGEDKCKSLLSYIDEKYDFEEGIKEILIFYIGCYGITKGLNEDQLTEFFQAMVEQFKLM